MRSAAMALLVALAACAPDGGSPTAVASRAFTFGPGAANAVAHADAVTDFESFTAGRIDGQFDWQSLGGAGGPGSGHGVLDHVIAVNAAGALPSFGARSLRISNAVATGAYADQTFSHRTADYAGQTGADVGGWALAGGVRRDHFEAEWSFASATPDAHQPGLEVVVSPARGDSHRMSWVQMSDHPDGLAVTAAVPRRTTSGR